MMVVSPGISVGRAGRSRKQKNALLITDGATGAPRRKKKGLGLRDFVVTTGRMRHD